MDLTALQIKEVDINSVLTDPSNTRKHSKKNMSAITASLSKFGQVEPLVVQKSTKIVIGGNGRLEAMKALSWEKCKIVEIDVDDVHAAALSIALNRTAELAEWGMDELTAQLKSLDDELREVAFADFELPEDDPDISEDSDEIPETEANEKGVELGDVWELGDHKLLCGDSTEFASYQTLMGESLADLVVTDPPYNVAYEGVRKARTKIKNDSMPSDDFKKFLSDVFSNLFTSSRKGCPIYIFYATSEHVNFVTAAKESGWSIRQQLTWLKQHFTLGRHDYHYLTEPCLYGWKEGVAHSWYGGRKQTTVLEYARPMVSKEHPTMKPVEMIAKLVTNSSKKGDLVIDSFGGSGTTLIACEQTGRCCRTIELEPHYCSVIIKRWENLTGKEAVRWQSKDRQSTKKSTAKKS